ncbi:efflux RND transporter permease subunit [Vreelandella populi]|uniref:Efflux RND transporter permease subunit n=1 Tax=Vreelandella populi TaxID=2498858 RepID=A0A3S0X3X0_9GAMM|nr:efflux RND transporter permease subunit [Halomonas populi]RUR40881.1 efflux RND transporter permease subunit [Halomonas populi]RUR49389.1 efflux RND transporter permease subunit [Halomonas populi]RUR55873.1 efflux RND transporter permease subunit [Halomonas populi]
MDIAKRSIEKPINTWLIVVICLFGGIWGFNTVGKLEDPSFTIPYAIINTPYPGATAEEVEEEVTERLERAIQEMEQLDVLDSKSLPGRSEIQVEIQDTYGSDELPQIWNELRNKVNDAQADLPQGALDSQVNDDFGEVYGLFYAVTAEGFSTREIRDISTFLQRELLAVPGVARVSTTGEREESIYIDISNERLTTLGIPIEQVINTIQTENAVEDAGTLRVGDRQVRLVARANIDSTTLLESIRIGRPGTTEQVALADIATVYRQPSDIPDHVVHYNGKAAFTLGIAGIATENIIEIGEAVEARMEELQSRIPLGVELNPLYEQHNVVNDAINDFLINLAMSVAIVIGVLCLVMGWKVGMVVGSTLLLTVLGTLFVMGIFNIEMERISLGALIIAMGMLVDNSIVVAEGMVTNIRDGMKAKKAASAAAKRAQMPLFGATLIGIMAFAGIGLSNDVTGEFMFSLFIVILVSLMLSWLLALTATPLFGYYLLRKKGEEDEDENEKEESADNSGQQTESEKEDKKGEQNDADSEDSYYGGIVYRTYRMLLLAALKIRIITVTALVVLTGVCMWAFTLVPQSFFPDSSTPLFFINYELPQGTDIRATLRDVGEIEAYILEHEDVVSVASFVGRGATRFMLTYSPEQPNTAYAQFIIRTNELDVIDSLDREFYKELNERYPNAQVRTQRLQFGPGDGADIEARFQGPSPEVLRELGDQARRLMAANPLLIDERIDWRQQELIVAPIINEERARIAGVTREDIAQTLQFASSGIRAGTYREGEHLIPITVRAPQAERDNVALLSDRQIYSEAQQQFVPITQVVDGFEIRSEEALIERRNRVRTLTVGAEPDKGYTAAQAFDAVRSEIEAIELPPGYTLEWGGEHENSGDAQESLGQQLPVSFLIMVLTSILLFGKLRQPLIVWLVVPMSVCGVVIGLLVTGLPFSFTALLGMLSLSGMLMKNAIVLVDEIDEQIRSGTARFTALVDASISRLRPVFLAAGTTILGMIPLLWDAFFNSMAITIMGGLLFASILTLIAVPTFYAMFFGIKQDEVDSQ